MKNRYLSSIYNACIMYTLNYGGGGDRVEDQMMCPFFSKMIHFEIAVPSSGYFRHQGMRMFQDGPWTVQSTFYAILTCVI